MHYGITKTSKLVHYFTEINNECLCDLNIKFYMSVSKEYCTFLKTCKNCKSKLITMEKEQEIKFND